MFEYFPYNVPVGVFGFALRMAASISSTPIPRSASAFGSICARTAYFIAPYTCTWDTPSTIEIRCAIKVSAYSSISGSDSTSEFNAKKRIGLSDGFDLRRLGGLGMPGGSCGKEAEIAVCTSCAAASMLRLRLNCRVIEVEPCEFEELIESMPAMPENCLSSGVATDAAIVSGFAPGRLALTLMVG